VLRRTFFTAPAVAAAGVLASCKKPAVNPSRMDLRVSAVRRLSMCPFYVTYESGYFAQEGFDVELEKDMGTAQSLPLLAGGKLDASFTSFGPPVVNAVSRGARVRVVGGREVISTSCGTAGTVFVSRRKFPKGVQSMRQLKGARIGVSNSAPQTIFWLDMMLQHEGMTLSDVEQRKMRETERIAAIHAGELDGFVATEPDMSGELAALGIWPGPSLSAVLPNFQYSHILFGSCLLDAPVETCARFLRAYFRGAAEFLAGKTPRFLADYAKESNLDPKLIGQRCRATFEPDGHLHLDDMRRYTEWMAAHDMCPGNLDVTAMVDTRFIEAIRTMKGT
jgi:NitT/TauT family transport system substrate-binding protein